MTTRTEGLPLEQLIDSICRVVGARRDVAAISVVPGRRLTYDELACARVHAAACRVHLTMDGDGVVRLARLGAAAAASSLRRSAWDAAEGRRHGS